MSHLPTEYRCPGYYILGFSQLILVFCVLWFLLSHVWFIELYTDDWYYGRIMSRYILFGVIMFIVEYIVGIWIVYCRICSSPQILRYIALELKNRRDRFLHTEQVV
jgi:asparagine N-glycosylation enzyme membrane subunit Stt3